MVNASRTVGLVAGLVLAGVAGVQTRPATSPVQTQSATSPQRALLDKYCVTCHNERLKTGGLMLDQADVDDMSRGAEILEKVARKVRSGAMPPAGVPRPDHEDH